MFSIFEKLISISIKIKNFFTFNRINSPNVDLGKGNLFLKQSVEIKPRSKGPYLLIKDNKFENENEKWMYFGFNVINLGSEPANCVQTYTEIYIEKELKFKSPISASSIIPPDMGLKVLSEDPRELVIKCTLDHPQNKYIFVAEYTDVKGKKFITLKALFFQLTQKKFSTREEKAFMLDSTNLDSL